MKREVHGALVLGSVGLGLAVLSLLAQPSSQRRLSISQATAIDGDTFISAGVHYRLTSIDAPELPGHCRGWRAEHAACAPGDPWQAKAALQAELNRGVSCLRLGPDYYHRTLVSCRTADGADLGQELITLGLAVPYR